MRELTLGGAGRFRADTLPPRLRRGFHRDLTGPEAKGYCGEGGWISYPSQWPERHIEEGLFAEAECVGDSWRFTSLQMRRAARMHEMERVFDVEPELAALVADLLEELDALRARLRQAGLD